MQVKEAEKPFTASSRVKNVLKKAAFMDVNTQVNTQVTLNKKVRWDFSRKHQSLHSSENVFRQVND